MDNSVLQSNGTFYWPVQENPGKQSVQGTAMAATTEGTAPLQLFSSLYDGNNGLPF